VAAVNGDGEGPRSRMADTDPASWRNWDPKPGEPFRRAYSEHSVSTSPGVATERSLYYPR